MQIKRRILIIKPLYNLIFYIRGSFSKLLITKKIIYRNLFRFELLEHKSIYYNFC
ncbi:5642_t:CDS:2 [Cetraspora pellucida]|uniref:5642_t:CDS:1 n=1 Tax=Cetraspora pellucida TaxID=1433469 RepID=A0A9N9HVL9_9GLOM|nr:5642_t:CDS:2 [Cetraspora pellucida]